MTILWCSLTHRSSSPFSYCPLLHHLNNVSQIILLTVTPAKILLPTPPAMPSVQSTQPAFYSCSCNKLIKKNFFFKPYRTHALTDLFVKVNWCGFFNDFCGEHVARCHRSSFQLREPGRLFLQRQVPRKRTERFILKKKDFIVLPFYFSLLNSCFFSYFSLPFKFDSQVLTSWLFSTFFK